jgi:cardiolipin synthase A/B
MPRHATTAEGGAPEVTDVLPVSSGSYPRRSGNRALPLVGGPAIVRRLHEAILNARHSVWLTIAFLSPDFHFLDGNGLLFDALDRAVERGLDVRLLVWRSNPETLVTPHIFHGSADQFALLQSQGRRFKIRWDRAATVFCQHQKSWVVDAGRPSEKAFVGGFNLTNAGLNRHDVFVEIAGPSVTDVQRNFVERWNEASDRHRSDGNWACDGLDELPLPEISAAPCGNSSIQIQRMMDERRYPPATSERSILEQYRLAIDSAKQTIYIENQAIPDPAVGRNLLAALERGVAVVLLVPAVPEGYVYAARRDPRQSGRFDCLEAMAAHEHFLVAGLSAGEGKSRHPVYVHAKVMIVDDAWMTIGSCNLHAYSLAGHTELNASIWDVEGARELRRRLYDLHLGMDTSRYDQRQAMGIFQAVARANRALLDDRRSDWQGHVFELTARTYAAERDFGFDRLER